MGRNRIAEAIANAKPVDDPKGDTPAPGAAKVQSVMAKSVAVTGRDSSEPQKGGGSARALGYDVGELNREYALVLMGSKAVVVREQSSGPVEDRLRILTTDAFRTMFLNRHTEFVDRDGKVKVITHANAWLSDRNRRDYDGMEFFPDPNNAPGSARYLNFWRGFAVRPIQKDGAYTVFEDHIRNNLCNGDAALYNWVFGWFAHLIQRPRERIGTALVFRGRMGTGKTKIGEVFGSLFPDHYFMVDDPRYVVGQFNVHMASCLLLQAEEAVWAGDKAAEGRIKGLITSKFQMIESKGIDPIRLHNYVRLVMTSNEDWVVPAGKDERRMCVLDIDPRCAQNHGYFREMDAEIENGGREALLHDLLNFDLSTVDLWTIPKTGALLEQKIRSFDSIDGWWFERLKSGTSTQKADTWTAEILCDALYDDYVASADKIGIRRKTEPATFGKRLRKLLPHLERRRSTIAAEPGVIRRQWVYDLPSLDDCRGFFEDAVGQAIAWDEP